MAKGNMDVGITGDASKLLREFEKAQEQANKLGRKLIEAGQSGVKGQESVGQSVTGTGRLIDGVITKVGLWATALVSIRTAVDGIKGVYDDIAAARVEAMGQVEGQRFDLSRLVSAVGPEKADIVVKQAEDLAAAGGAASRDDALQKMTALELANQNTPENRAYMAEMNNVFGGQTGEVVKQAGLLQSALGDTGESLRDITSAAMALVQNNVARNMTPDELIRTAAESVKGAGLMGWTMREALAATAVLSQSMGASEVPGALNSLARGLGKAESLEGKPLPEQAAGFAKLKLDYEHMTAALTPELMGTLEAGLPTATIRGEGGKREHPFKGMTPQEAFEKMGTMKEGELDEALGDVGPWLQAQLNQYVSYVKRGMVNTIEGIQSQGLKQENLAPLVGRGIFAYKFLERDLADLKSAIAMEGEAQNEDLAGRTAAGAMRRPEVRAATEKKQAEVGKEILAVPQGTEGLKAEEIKQRYLNEMKAEGWNAASRWLGKKFIEMELKWGGTTGPARVARDFGTEEEQREFVDIQNESRANAFNASMRLFEKSAEDIRIAAQTFKGVVEHIRVQGGQVTRTFEPAGRTRRGAGAQSGSVERID